MTLVFDAEPLLAFFGGEDGAAAVRDRLLAVAAGHEEAVSNAVNLAEVLYVLRRRDPGRADGLLDWLLQAGIGVAPCEDTWREAARIKALNAVPLGDAFALATAVHTRGTLVVGRDPHFDIAKKLGVDVVRVGRA